jgi:hypothetical protein
MPEGITWESIKGPTVCALKADEQAGGSHCSYTLTWQVGDELVQLQALLRLVLKAHLQESCRRDRHMVVSS